MKLKKISFTITSTFFSFIALESLLIFICLALRPSDPQSRKILLYSLPRLAEMLIALGVTGVAMWGLKHQEKITALFQKELTLYSGLTLFIFSRLALILLQAFAQSPDLGSLTGYAEHLRPLSFFFSLIGFEIALWTLLSKRQNKTYLTIWGFFNAFAVFSVLISTSLITEWVSFGIWAVVTAILLHTTKENAQLAPLTILVALAAFVLQISLQAMMRPYAVDNFYFQEWSSEKMMAAVPLKDLQNTPLETLAYVHSKPPGFAAIRALFVHLWNAEDTLTALRHVDFLIYQFYAMLYSIMGGIAFVWLHKKTNFSVALVATFALLVHPAMLLYATLLDSNFLTAFLVLIFYYLLWKLKNKEDVSTLALILATLALFFTRSIFQYPFIIVAAAAFFIAGLKPQKLAVFLAVTVAVTGAFAIQHQQKFGTISTSSFTGLNLNRSVGNPDFVDYWSMDVEYQPQDDSLPKSLTRTRKTDGSPNYNHIQYLQYNAELIEAFKSYLLGIPPLALCQTYWENVTIYFQPSSIYHTGHAIIDHVPWRRFYDTIFSSPILPILLMVFGIYATKKVLHEKDYLPTLGFILPALYIFAITVLFEKGENMRFKFFIEPLLFIFLISQLYEIVTRKKA